MKAQTTWASRVSAFCHTKEYDFHVGADTSLLYSQPSDEAVAHRQTLDIPCNLGLKQYNFSLNRYLKLQDFLGEKKIPYNLN